MRAFLPILLTLCACMALGEDRIVPAPQQPPEHVDAPRNLEEAHQQLETLLTPEDLVRIDAMKSEKEMVQYHLNVGMAIRNQWGLWGGSPLAVSLWQDGFEHSEDMAAVILATFWCKRHRRDFRLDERADYYRAYWKAVAEPPPDAGDPRDASAVEWLMSFDAGSDEKPRQIHIGRSKKTGRWLAYECTCGVYVPDQALTKKIVTFNSDPFTEKK